MMQQISVMDTTIGNTVWPTVFQDTSLTASTMPLRSSSEYTCLKRCFSLLSSYGHLRETYQQSLSLIPHRRYVARDIISLTGDLDTYKNGPFGDTSCKAKVQGTIDRRDRNYAQWAYKNLLAGTDTDVSGESRVFSLKPASFRLCFPSILIFYFLSLALLLSLCFCSLLWVR